MMNIVRAMEPPLGQPVIPGDRVFKLPESGVVRVGTGLHDDGSHLIAARPGLLQQSKQGKLWIFGKQKRYIPSVDDSVLGIVTRKQSEYYEVDIGAPFTALLPVLAFEGATRRNRPNLKEGDLVYCRIDMADRDLQPTVTCMDAAGRAAGFGPLTGGFVIECSTAYARVLLAEPRPAFLTALGCSVQFEAVVGVNGKIWVVAASQADVVMVSMALQTCEGQPAERAEATVVAMIKAHRKAGHSKEGTQAMQD